MSRIGNAPVTLPAGVSFKTENNTMTVKGSMGELKQDFDSKAVSFDVQGNVVTVKRSSDQKNVKAKHGLYRALLNNMVVGVTKGFEKSLIINGVGYKATPNGKGITLNVGYSHTVDFFPPQGITIDCPTITEVVVKGIDKEKVGQAASDIRQIRVVEPYHLYGIRYKDEKVQKKEGKTAGK